MIAQFVREVGHRTIMLCQLLGSFCIFLGEACFTLVTTKPRIHKIFVQMKTIGVDSFSIIVLTGAFSGAVLALQSYSGFKKFGASEFIGPIVALSMIRELGPVLTGLMVTGRAGSAITAEIGTMSITEQIDALKTLCINPFQYLIIPRILGSMIIVPFLCLFSMFFGILGGYAICVYVLHVSGEQYISGIDRFVDFQDIMGGLAKAATFGLILSWIGCYKGYYADGGAKGVGIATTKSVVTSSIMILIANYFLASIIFR